MGFVEKFSHGWLPIFMTEIKFKLLASWRMPRLVSEVKWFNENDRTVLVRDVIRICTLENAYIIDIASSK